MKREAHRTRVQFEKRLCKRVLASRVVNTNIRQRFDVPQKYSDVIGRWVHVLL